MVLGHSSAKYKTKRSKNENFTILASAVKRMLKMLNQSGHINKLRGWYLTGESWVNRIEQLNIMKSGWFGANLYPLNTLGI